MTILKLIVPLLLFPSFLFGADISTQMMPAPHISINVRNQSEVPAIKIVRDAGIGLGVGAMVGLGLTAVLPGGFSSGPNQMHSEALATSLIVGLASGIVTGIWEVKRDKIISDQHQAL